MRYLRPMCDKDFHSIWLALILIFLALLFLIPTAHPDPLPVLVPNACVVLYDATPPTITLREIEP